MPRRFSIAGTLLALALGCLAGCGGAGTPPPPKTGWVADTLRIGEQADFKSLDPAKANDTESIPFVRMIFQPLLEYDDGVNLTPLVAESMPELSADRMTYTFHIRKDVRFSDGRIAKRREVTADDYVYAWTRVLDPATNSPGSTYIADDIAGAQEYIHWKEVEKKQKTGADLSDGEKQTPKAETVSGLRAVDANTLEVKLVHPDATFPYITAMPYFAPVPREEIEQYREEDRSEEFSMHPIGTGPFVLKEWRRATRMRLERDPHYWGPNPPALQALDVKFGLDDLTMQMMFERGELDLMSQIPSAAYVRLKHDPRWQPYFEKLVVNGEYFLALNCEMEPFNGPNGEKVRKAFCYAIDKDRLVQISNDRYVAATGVVPPNIPGYKSGVKGYTYDPEKAKQLLAEAGYPNGDGLPGPLTLWVPNERTTLPRMAEVIQQDLKAIGVKVEISEVHFDVFQAATGKHKTAFMALAGWYQDYPDPSDFLDVLFSSHSITDADCNNLAFYHSDKADALMDAADQERNPATRMKLFAEAEQVIVDEDAPVVPLVNGQEIWLRQPWVSGFHIHPVLLIKYEKLSIAPP